MKSPGEKVKKNESVLSLIHEGKQINIYAPFSGTIKEINEDLVTDPSLINRSPYSEGWIYMMEPSNWEREIRFFKIAKVYKEWLKSEFTRLKDFFAVFVKPVPDGYAQGIFQDGGELKDGILADFGPEVWEDFQTNFIETSE